jgi:hypothetical protein
LGFVLHHSLVLRFAPARSPHRADRGGVTPGRWLAVSAPRVRPDLIGSPVPTARMGASGVDAEKHGRFGQLDSGQWAVGSGQVWTVDSHGKEAHFHFESLHFISFISLLPSPPLQLTLSDVGLAAWGARPPNAAGARLRSVAAAVAGR